MHLQRKELRIAVIGSGGHSKEVIAALQMAGHEVAAILDDDPTRLGQRVLDVEVIGSLSLLYEQKHTRNYDGFILGIGDNPTRCRLAQSLQLKWLNVVHPAACVHSSARLGEGSVVFAGAVVQPECHIGAHAIINTAASISHDCVVGDYAHIAPGARLAGGVHVGYGAFVGIGSCVAPQIEIGEWATLGAGSVVVRPIAPRVVAYGVPARAQCE